MESNLICRLWSSHLKSAGVGNMSAKRKTGPLVEHDFGLFCRCFTPDQTLSQFFRREGDAVQGLQLHGVGVIINTTISCYDTV